MPAVVLAATLDTKADEIAFARAELQRLGQRVLVIDCGVLADPPIAPDIAAAEVARAGGSDLSLLRRQRDRATAIPAMMAGLQAVLADLLRQGAIAAFMGIGGGTNAALAAAAFRTLPFGMPKLLVSTVACGNTRPFIGIKDVLLFHSVVDVLGLNEVLRQVLRQAAAALSGMLALPRPAQPCERRAPCIAMTTYGATTAAAMHALPILQQAGFEVLCFHARGVGGEAMEALVRAGGIHAVLDLTTTEVADEIVGGVCSAGPDRLTAAGEAGLPQVILPGALDMVNFGPPATVPERFHGRNLVSHTPNATLMRTTPQENVEMADFIARRLNAAKGPVAVVLPLRGFSAYDARGEPFFDPEADAAFRAALVARLVPGIRVAMPDAHLNDRETVDTATALLLGMMADAAARRAS